jgi:hypothetical protein
VLNYEPQSWLHYPHVLRWVLKDGHTNCKMQNLFLIVIHLFILSGLSKWYLLLIWKYMNYLIQNLTWSGRWCIISNDFWLTQLFLEKKTDKNTITLFIAPKKIILE